MLSAARRAPQQGLIRGRPLIGDPNVFSLAFLVDGVPRQSVGARALELLVSEGSRCREDLICTLARSVHNVVSDFFVTCAALRKLSVGLRPLLREARVRLRALLLTVLLRAHATAS